MTTGVPKIIKNLKDYFVAVELILLLLDHSLMLVSATILAIEY